MKIKLRMLLIILLAFFVGSLVQAGIYVMQKIHVDPINFQGQSQPEKNMEREIWIEDYRMISFDKDQNLSIIVLLGEKKIYFVKHDDKSCVVGDLPILSSPEVQKMTAMFAFKTEIRKTGNKKKIKTWDCEEVVMTLSGFMDAKITMWCTGDIHIPFENYYKMASEMAAVTPAIKEMLTKMHALGDLFPIEQEMTGKVMGVETRTVTRVVKAVEMTIPAEKFIPPPEYKQEKLDLSKLMMGKL